MSIEDRSLDASKEEGTATVIDGSDHGWNRPARPVLLHSMSRAGEGYLRIDSNGSLRADGDKDNSDHDTRFTVHIIDNNEGLQFVILQPYMTKVVAIDANTKNFITKVISQGTLQQLNNWSMVKEKHPDILFQKIQRKESALFHLKPYCGDTGMFGFKKADDPIVTTTTVDADKYLFKMHE